MCTATASNGSIDVIIANGSEGDHDFEWYESLGTTGSVISTSATLTNATAGEYTVQITNKINGCTTDANATVVDEPAIPMVTLDETDNTSCNSPNGAVTANTEGPATDYSFEWYEGEEAEGQIIGAIQSISNLSQGIYNVRVTDLTTACAIQLVAMVADAHVLPGITIGATPNGDCSGSHPNGELKAIVDAVAEDDRDIAWYAGENPEGEIIETASTLTGLSAGTYTVKVINEITGCLDVATATIDNVPNTPVITVNVVNNTSCVDSPNGELTASTEGSAGDYTFNWYEGEILSGNYIGSGVTQNSLAAGMYTVEAADINTGCASSVSAMVADDCTITGNNGSATKDNISLECYPNPASTSLRVISRVNGTISLIDMTGRTFVTHAVSPSPDPVTLDLSGMPDGRYLVRLKEGWKITYHQIVVEK